MSRANYVRNRVLRREELPTACVIETPLAREQCWLRLTGREEPGRLGSPFTAALRLRGTVFRDSLILRLPSLAIFGEIESGNSGTHLRLSVSTRRADVQPMFDLAVFAFLVAIPLIAYEWWRYESLPGFLVVPAIFLALVLWRERSMTWPAYPQTPEDAARMLAGLLGGSVESHRDR